MKAQEKTEELFITLVEKTISIHSVISLEVLTVSNFIVKYINLINNGSFAATKTDLSAGLHQFNFSCVLPPQLPTRYVKVYFILS